jgi:hypothetical protein
MFDAMYLAHIKDLLVLPYVCSRMRCKQASLPLGLTIKTWCSAVIHEVGSEVLVLNPGYLITL